MKTLGIILGLITFVFSVCMFTFFIINVFIGDIKALQNSGLLFLLSAPFAVYIIWSLDNLNK